MSNPTHWVFPDEAHARDVQTAFAVADGLPRKGSQSGPGRGRGKRKGVPPTHSQGAFGWSDDLVDVDRRDTAGPNRWAIQRATECGPYEGQTVDIGPGPDIVLPTAGTAVPIGAGEWVPQPKAVGPGPGTRPGPRPGKAKGKKR